MLNTGDRNLIRTKSLRHSVWNQKILQVSLQWQGQTFKRANRGKAI